MALRLAENPPNKFSDSSERGANLMDNKFVFFMIHLFMVDYIKHLFGSVPHWETLFTSCPEPHPDTQFPPAQLFASLPLVNEVALRLAEKPPSKLSDSSERGSNLIDNKLVFRMTSSFKFYVSKLFNIGFVNTGSY
jgi:hypothetical protein